MVHAHPSHLQCLQLSYLIQDQHIAAEPPILPYEVSKGQAEGQRNTPPLAPTELGQHPHTLVLTRRPVLHHLPHAGLQEQGLRQASR
jgi:hypothetical protein